jgi:hypothetical protein
MCIYIVIKVYDDTKIRLHFSHFKILEKERETCFLDKPHQCPDYAADKNVNTNLNSHIAEEL